MFAQLGAELLFEFPAPRTVDHDFGVHQSFAIVLHHHADEEFVEALFDLAKIGRVNALFVDDNGTDPETASRHAIKECRAVFILAFAELELWLDLEPGHQRLYPRLGKIGDLDKISRSFGSSRCVAPTQQRLGIFASKT